MTSTLVHALHRGNCPPCSASHEQGCVCICSPVPTFALWLFAGCDHQDIVAFNVTKYPYGIKMNDCAYAELSVESRVSSILL